MKRFTSLTTGRILMNICLAAIGLVLFSQGITIFSPFFWVIAALIVCGLIAQHLITKEQCENKAFKATPAPEKLDISGVDPHVVLDILLDRVAQHGIQSLTSAERETLVELSQKI